MTGSTEDRPVRGDGTSGRRLVIGLVLAAMALAVFAFIYRNEAWRRHPTTLPDSGGQVMR